MPDYLGDIEVPEIAPSGTFPIVSDYGYGQAHHPEVVVHRFGSANSKIEQRFLLGNGAKRFTVRRAQMREADRIALRNFWETCYGPYGAFTYNAPDDDGDGTTAYTCRFANEPLSWEFLSDAISSVGVTLIEIPDPDDAPTYTVNSTVTRFPSSGLKTALLSQVQTIIPLIKIQPREVGYSAIYVSDRRCTVGGQLYLPRLLDFAGIEQSIGNESDQAQFTFGNADRVMRALANDVDLFRASIEFSLFHVGTGIKLDLWKGEIVDWTLDQGPVFSVTAADGMYELNLPYPTRRVSRSCWKCFDDANGCPYTAQSTGLDTTHFPDVDAASCDKGYETANGCLAHGMKHYFGGILAEPQGVRVKDNSEGTWGYGRPTITSVSLVQDSIYDELIPEIYTDNETYVDKDGVTRTGRRVNCKIAAGRDESDFYEALGIVGEGPVSFGTDHKLDSQLHHGPGTTGIRTIPGNDPAAAGDYFSLDEAGDLTAGDFRKVYSGASTFKDNFAAGTAGLVIRRNDDKGIQLTYPGGHEMQAVVLTGLQGWVWTAAGTRSLATLSNPIWIAVNMMLRARGLRYASAATAELYFDVTAAIAAAAICDETVTPFISRTYKYWVPEEANPDPPPATIPGHWEGGEITAETQFLFQGIIQEEKPLRDWIQEVLMNCLGYYSFAFGKLKLGVRCNSSVVEAFTEGNILYQSLQLSPLKPSFNHLTGNFGDAEFAFAGNSVTVYDVDHAKLIGGATAPLFLKSQMNLSGCTHKSQAARIISVRMREELGGITAAQWKAARQISFRTTILALNTEPGMVCSMTHDDMPDGVLNDEPEPTYGEFRVTGWKLNKDYSIDIEGRTTVNEMYDLVDGPKPADVAADAVPVEIPQTGIPDDLKVTSVDPALHCTFGATAWKYKENITGARFRAKFSATEPAGPVDLRTVAEGGTMAHDPANGMYVIDDIYANYISANYEFDSAAAGYWSFAFQFKSPSGSSVWSDGNRKPQYVTDYLPTDSIAAEGPPNGWWVEVEPDEVAHRVRVRASRPTVNGAKIWYWFVQIKDNRTGHWSKLNTDDVTGGEVDNGASIHYGNTVGDTGGAIVGDIPHSLTLDNRRLTRETGVGLYGDPPTTPSLDYVHIGDLILFDRRGGQWDVDYCQWGAVDTIQGLKSGFDLNTATFFDVAGRFGSSVFTDLRLLVVKAPWDWVGLGYLGDQPNKGWWRKYFWENGKHGDTETEVFVSDWLDVPADVPLSAIEARVFFSNGYSCSDGNPMITGGVVGDLDNPSGAHDLEILTHEDDSAIPDGQIALQFHRETTNYKGIFAVAAWLSSDLPAEGPYAAERLAHADCVLETGSCTIVRGDKSVTVTRAADPGVVGKVLLIFINDYTPDTDLDGQVIESEAADSLMLGVPFKKSGSFDYAIVEPWWDRAGGFTTNLMYVQFAPLQCAGSIEQEIWRTPCFSAPGGEFNATLTCINAFGIGTRLTAGPGVAEAGCLPLTVVAGAVDIDASLGKVFCVNTGGAALTVNNPTGGNRSGQPILLVITGAGAVTLGNKWNLMDGETIARSGGRDMLGGVYNATADLWDAFWKKGA